MPEKATLKTVAEAAGVSLATASLALRNRPMVAEETCRRVQQIAARLRYRPDPIATTLAAQRADPREPSFRGQLAFLTGEDVPAAVWKTWSTHRKLHAGAKRRAEQLGYGMEEYSLFDPAISPTRLRSILASRGVPGLLLHRMQGEGYARLRRLGTGSFACAALGWRCAEEHFHSATNDQFEAVALGMRRMRELGYRRVGLLLDPGVDLRLAHRFRGGYLGGFTFAEGDVPPPVWSELDDHPGIVKWIRGYKIDAVLSLPYPFHTVLRRLGFSIPRDLGFAYLDVHAEDPLFEDCAGVDQRQEAVGSAGVDLVVSQLHRREAGAPDCQKVVMIEGLWREGWSAPARGRGRRGRA
jgi:DNA-binding LacI/PurR family transcriptional regulator